MNDVQRSAVLSEDGLYRYRLDRSWGGGPRVAFTMLNPSTADAREDDPTIRRCIGFARAWGYDGLTVVNLYPFRATSPAVMEMWLDGPASDDDSLALNTVALLQAAQESALMVAAWGVHGARDGEAARTFLSNHITRWHHLGLTKDGHPRHPLYVKGDTKPIPWPAIGPTSDGGMNATGGSR